MTPFILWLTKGEVDEMISILLQNKVNPANQDEFLTIEELTDITNILLKQNETLFDLVKKLKPFSVQERSKANFFRAKQKCNHFYDEIDKMMVHCHLHNQQLNGEYKVFKDNLCKECSLKEKKGKETII